MKIKAGWSHTDITPPLGLPLGGRGPRFTPGAKILDRLKAQALILQDARGQRTLWVSMDLVTISADCHCQFIQGLAGNIRPRVLADLENGVFRKSTAADPDTAGSRLASDVEAALKLPGEVLELDIAAAEGCFEAPRDPAKIPPLSHWQALKSRDNELEQNLGAYWSDRLESGIPPVSVVPWPESSCETGVPQIGAPIVKQHQCPREIRWHQRTAG